MTGDEKGKEEDKMEQDENERERKREHARGKYCRRNGSLAVGGL